MSVQQIETAMFCPHCRRAGVDKLVVADVEFFSTRPLEQIPLGPDSRDCFRRGVSALYCPTCRGMFHDPELCAKVLADLDDHRRQEEYSLPPELCDEALRLIGGDPPAGTVLESCGDDGGGFTTNVPVEQL